MGMQQVISMRVRPQPRPLFGVGPRQGFGFWFDDDNVGGGDAGGGDPGYIPTIIEDPDIGGNDSIYGPPEPYPQSSGPSIFEQSLPALIAAGLKTISNIFAPVGTSVAQAQGSPYAYQQQYQQGAYRTSSTGVGIGLDGNGIRLSDGSHIGWMPIIAVGFGFFLLQSKGFSRR